MFASDLPLEKYNRTDERCVQLVSTKKYMYFTIVFLYLI